MARPAAGDEEWFDHDTPLKTAPALPRPAPAELMEAGEASTLVNSPKNEGPRLLDQAV